MADKSFETITYEDNNGNGKGRFEKFQFASTGPHAPYNEGYGQNLTVTREKDQQKVPHMGFRAPLKIEQEALRNDPQVRIAFTSPQLRQDAYGMTFAIKFLRDTDKAVESMSLMTDEGGVNVGQSIKGLGAITVHGTTYHYYLGRIDASSDVRDETTVQFNFTSSKLKKGEMEMEIFEGFIFNNFSTGDYQSANMTTNLTFPHQKDFDHNKFQDVMLGDVLLAGMLQDDGTVTANEKLRLTTPSILGALPHHLSLCLGYISPARAVTDNAGWCFSERRVGYAVPIIPCRGTKEIMITLLTHSFDADSVLPTNNLNFQFRLKLYHHNASKTTEKVFNEIYYNSPLVKRSSDHANSSGGLKITTVFYLNMKLAYQPVSTCIGFALEFRQTQPTAQLGNENELCYEVIQEGRVRTIPAS